MQQIRHGSVSQPYLDNQFMKTELPETAAQLEALPCWKMRSGNSDGFWSSNTTMSAKSN